MLIRTNIMVHPAHLPPNGLVADDIALFQRGLDEVRRFLAVRLGLR